MPQHKPTTGHEAASDPMRGVFRRRPPSPTEQERRKVWAAEWSQVLKGRKRKR